MKFFPVSLISAVLAMGTTQTLAADDPKTCGEVRMSDLGWTDIMLTNTTAQVILDALGYKVDQTLLGLNVTYESMKGGDIDVFLGNWRPAQDEEFKPYFDNGDVAPVAVNLTGAKYTLAVPQYVYDAGVHSFDDLATHADKFDRNIYGIEAGTNLPLLDMVKANRHDLGGWTIVESSEAGMLSQVKRATGRNDWIVFLGWQPHPMNTEMKLQYLSGGDEEFGPDFGGATVRTIVRKGYADQCPNAAKFFSNLTFDIAYENEGMSLMTDKGETAPDAAKAMIAQHPEKLTTWLAGVETLDGKPGLAAVQAELGAAK